MAQNVALSFEEELSPSPGPLAGFVVGVLLSVALWLLVGCVVLVVRVLGGVG